MKFIPVGLSLSGKKILLVGGGKAALQKIRCLTPFTKRLTVLAPAVAPEIKKTGVRWIRGMYRASLLKGYAIVYACTGDSAVNRRVRNDARRLGILVNVVDDPSQSDFISPAIYKFGRMTISVSSDGQNARASIQLRDRIRQCFESRAAVECRGTRRICHKKRKST